MSIHKSILISITGIFVQLHKKNILVPNVQAERRSKQNEEGGGDASSPTSRITRMLKKLGVHVRK